jgi:hypothetical protein
MPIPDRPPSDYHYHVYDHPGSAAFVSKDQYTRAELRAWLGAWAAPGGTAATYDAAERDPYSRRGFADEAVAIKRLICRTFNRRGSEVTGRMRYSLIRDMEQLRTEANMKNLNAALRYAATYFNRKIYVLTFGSGAADAPQILLTGGIHGREWIAVETPYLIAEYLIKNYNHNAAGGTKAGALRDLIESCQFWVIPLLNPDGHSWSLAKDRLWRTNRKRYRWSDLNNNHGFKVQAGQRGHENNQGVFRGFTRDTEDFYIGVDCNRNCYWSQNVNPQPDFTKETFAGPSAVSENESRIIDDCALGGLSDVAGGNQNPRNLTNLVASIDYHSAKGAIMYDDDLGNPADVPADPMKKNAKVAGKFMQKHVLGYDGNASYAFGNTSTVVHADSNGSLMHSSYMAMDHAGRAPLAYTIELDPINDNSANRWSLPRDRIQYVFEKNLLAILCLIYNAAVNPGNLTAVANASGDQIIPSGDQCNFAVAHCCNFHNWNVTDRGNSLPA